jgi:hypothetical protein
MGLGNRPLRFWAGTPWEIRRVFGWRSRLNRLIRPPSKFNHNIAGVILIAAAVRHLKVIGVFLSWWLKRVKVALRLVNKLR